MILGERKAFVKTAEVQGGEVITFRNEGEWVKNTKFTYEDGSPKNDFIILVELGGEEKSMRLSKMNRETLINAYSKDTENWIGQTARITKVKAAVGGKMMDMIVLEVSIPEGEETE